MTAPIPAPALVAWDAHAEQATPAQLAPWLELHDSVPRWRWWLTCQDAAAMLQWVAPHLHHALRVLGDEPKPRPVPSCCIPGCLGVVSGPGEAYCHHHQQHGVGP